jgi:hypothetical protein
MKPALERLEKIAQLDRDWDSYGAAPIAPRAVAAGRKLIMDVADQLGADFGGKSLPFTVAPLVDGGVQVEWRGPTREIEVEIGPDEEFGYLLIVRTEAGRDFQEGDKTTRSEILDLIAQVLNS